MKRILITSLLSCFAITCAQAEVTWVEPFNYSDGSLDVVASGIWFNHSGSSDLFVTNHILQVSSAPRSGDMDRRFAAANTTNVFASMTMRFATVPNVNNGTYIAHFQTNTTTGFMVKLFALTNGTVLPGTYRLGISAFSSTAPDAVVPFDMFTNVDYQVVMGWKADINALDYGATLWVDPTNAADTAFVRSVDSSKGICPTVGFTFRQASGMSYFTYVTNLAVGTTFDDAATNVWPAGAVAPKIGLQPKNTTNFVGASVSLVAAAAGQGQSSLIYQWRKNGALYTNPNGNSGTLTFASAGTGDTGDYDVVVTNYANLTVTSASAHLQINNNPIPPSFTSQPATNQAVYAHQTVILQVAASGPPTITFEWYRNSVDMGISGDSLTLSDIQTNNGTTGTYYCIASNPNGNTQSSNYVVSVIPVPVVSVGYLRTLVDGTYQSTNGTTLYNAVGTVTTYTNTTTGNTASYYLQDATAGINIFATFGSNYRPQQGDVVSFIGFLSTFQNSLELSADLQNNAATGGTFLSNNIAGLPAPQILGYEVLTNNNAYLFTNLLGRFVALTNVYFGTNAGRLTYSGTNLNVIATNDAGAKFAVLLQSSMDNDMTNRTVPAFANMVIGVLTGSTNTLNSGAGIMVTRWSDIVTSPLGVTSVTHSGSTANLGWQAVPYSLSYSLLGTPTLGAGFTTITNGLRFYDTNGSYSDTSASGSAKFYKLTTP